MRFGRYDLLRRIGEGGMSEVFLAKPAGAPEELAARVVIKRMRPTLADDDRFVALFKEESRIAATMHHPNVVKVFESGEVYGQLFIAMEYVDGVDCWRLVNAGVASGAPPTPRVACYVVTQALRGLAHVHEARDEGGAPMGVVHGDVSPTNVYVSRTGDVKLGDFGIARRRHRELTTGKSQLTGKVAYMAPEQVLGLPFDFRADLFAAGTVLAELLIQDRLFATKSHLTTLLAIRDVRLDAIEPHRHKLPPGMESYLSRALAKDPKARFESATAMADALATFLDGADEGGLREELASLVGDAVEDRTKEEAEQHDRPTVPAPPEVAEAVAASGTSPSSRRSGSVLVETDSFDVELDVDIDIEERSRDSLYPTPVPDIDDLDAMGHHTPTTPVGPIAQVTFRRADGRVLGPMHFPAALDKVMEGAVGPEDAVSVEGSPFKPIGEVDELARFLPTPTPTTGQVDAVPPPDRRALLVDEPVARLIARLANDRETGMAVFEHGPIRKDIYFEDGDPTHVSSNMASELLGEFLVRSGVISRMELEMAFALLPKFDNHLGDTLVGLGLVDSVTLFRHISEQVRGKLLDLFGWTRGEFRYYRGVKCPQTTFPLGIQSLGILWEGLAKHWDEEASDSWLESHGGLNARLGESPVVKLDMVELPVGVRTALIEDALPMQVSRYVDRIARRGSISRTEITLLLRLAAELGVIDLTEG